MSEKGTPVLLVTANVGSVFEEPSTMLKVWTEEFLSTVTRLDPKFIALHCQEVGGKNYERSMKHVEFFVNRHFQWLTSIATQDKAENDVNLSRVGTERQCVLHALGPYNSDQATHNKSWLLMSSEELRLFDKVRVYLDEDYSSAENFTALGSLYFIHESITDVLIWDFSDLVFVPATGKEVFSGNIEAISTKEKSKFPQDFFPECKWSRKGFLRTRWSLHGTVLDLINIHLFHDASNFIAMESFPSIYCKNRRRALEHTLDRFHSDENGTAPFFLFGDFNFRTDSQGVIQKLCEGLQPIRLQSNKTDHTKLQYQDEASQVIFSLGRKEFSHHDHETLFIENEASWLKAFDRELEPFEGRLYEFPISFPPSYPFEEEEEKGPKSYMQTRCPSWCDRVVLSSSAKSLVNNISEPGSVEYGLVGPNTCMGDHKPVYLRLLLAAGAGRVECCTSPHQNAWPCTRSMSLQADHLFVPDAHQPLYASLSVDVNYLPLPCTTHEPYTPESVDTPSPAPSSPLHVESLQDKLKLFVEQQSGDMTAVSSSDVVDSNLKLDVGSDDKQLTSFTKFTDAHITKSSNFSSKSDFIDSHNSTSPKSIEIKNSNCACLDTNDVIDTWIFMEHCDTNVPYILEPNLTIGDRSLHLDETSPKHNKYTPSMEDEPPEIRKGISLLDDKSSNAVKDDLLKNEDICSPFQRTAPWLVSKKYDTWRGSREQEVNRCHSDTLLKRKSMQICRLCGQLCPSSQFWLKNQRSLSDKNLHWLCDNWKKNCEANRIPFLINADYLHSMEKTSTCGTQQNEHSKEFPVLKCDRLVDYSFDDKIERVSNSQTLENFQNDDQINPLLLECSMRKAEDETAAPLSQDDKLHYDTLLLESVKDESEKASKCKNTNMFGCCTLL